MLNRSIISNRRQLARLLFFFFGAILFASCQQPKAETESKELGQKVPPTALETRFDMVRAIHDKVMPERGHMIRLQRSVADADLETGVTAFAKTRLERADDMMMDWMYSDIPLNKLVDSLDEASIYSYIDTREREIQEVSDSMMTAIQFAESILAQ